MIALLKSSTGKFIAVAAVIASGIFATGCYKSPEFINPVYDCDCGSMVFVDSTYALKMAEIVVPDSLEPLSRSYHIVADLRTAEEIDAHVPARDLTFSLSFDVCDDNVYYVQQVEVEHLVQLIDQGDDIYPVRNFKATDGYIEIDRQFGSGPEPVVLDLVVREWVDSSFVGSTIKFTSEFTGIID